jgi:hypothetical protein
MLNGDSSGGLLQEVEARATGFPGIFPSALQHSVYEIIP